MRRYRILQDCKMYKIIDNFLDEHDFNKILSVINNVNYEWTLWSKANENSKEGQFHFAHSYINEGKIIKNLDDNVVYIIMKKVTELYKKTQAVIRARTNLFVKTEKTLYRNSFISQSYKIN